MNRRLPALVDDVDATVVIRRRQMYWSAVHTTWDGECRVTREWRAGDFAQLIEILSHAGVKL